MTVAFTSGMQITVDEAGAGVAATSAFLGGTLFDDATGCTLSGDRTQVTCPAAQVDRVAVASADTASDLLLVGGDLTKPLRWDAGAGDDSGNVFLGAGSSATAREELHGGPGRISSPAAAGRDLLDGGPGADRLVFTGGRRARRRARRRRGRRSVDRRPRVRDQPRRRRERRLGADRTGNVHSDVEDAHPRPGRRRGRRLARLERDPRPRGRRRHRRRRRVRLHRRRRRRRHGPLARRQRRAGRLRPRHRHRDRRRRRRCRWRART